LGGEEEWRIYNFFFLISSLVLRREKKKRRRGEGVSGALFCNPPEGPPVVPSFRSNIANGSGKKGERVAEAGGPLHSPTPSHEH